MRHISPISVAPLIKAKNFTIRSKIDACLLFFFYFGDPISRIQPGFVKEFDRQRHFKFGKT
jgi:hypothetical protein